MLRFQGQGRIYWSQLLHPSRLHLVAHKQLWREHVKTLMLCSTVSRWQSTAQRSVKYLVFHWHTIPLTPLLIQKQTYATSIQFLRIFSPVTSEQRKTFHVYMQVTDIISQRYLCVAHHAVRALVGCYGWRHTHTQKILKNATVSAKSVYTIQRCTKSQIKATFIGCVRVSL